MRTQVKLFFFLLFLLGTQAVKNSLKKQTIDPCVDISTSTTTGTTGQTATTTTTTGTTTGTTATTTTPKLTCPVTSSGSTSTSTSTSTSGTTSTSTSTTPSTSTTTTPSTSTSTTPSTSTTTTSTSTGTRDYKVGIYFGNWKIYARGFQLCSIPIEKVDRIFYGFWDPTAGECRLNDEWADIQKPGPADGTCGGANQVWDAPLKGNLYQLKKLRERNPNLKVYPSIGGWTYSPLFHNYIKNPADRAKLVSSCVNLFLQYTDVFNGLDVDFEFPCLPDDPSCGWNIIPTDNDRQYFADLMAEFRAALPSQYPLDIATSAAQNKIDALDFARLNLAISSYNIMSYDFTSGSWGDPWTGHQTNTYLNPADPQSNNRTFSVDSAVQYFIKNGADAKKINVGVGMYGRGFKFAVGTTPAPFVRSLGGLSTGTWETNTFDYYDIKANYAGANNANVYWDDVAKAPYVFDSAKGIYITYDDVRSTKAKVDYARKYGLEGVFSWEISGDSNDFELLRAMTGDL